MRIIDTIKHPSMTISIMQMNDKYIVRFEAGPLEQVFKFIVTEVRSLERLKELINEDFIDDVRIRFNQMYVQYREAFERRNDD